MVEELRVRSVIAVQKCTDIMWQVELLQLSHNVHPPVCYLEEEADIQPPLEVLSDDGPQEMEMIHSVDSGVTQGDEGVWVWAIPEVLHHLHSFWTIFLQVVLTAPGHQMVNLLLVGKLISIRDESGEGSVIRKRQELDRHITGGAAGRRVGRKLTVDSASDSCDVAQIWLDWRKNLEGNLFLLKNK